MAKITRKTKSFGWGYSFTPTGADAYSIVPPAAPDHTGTVKQVIAARDEDRTWNARGGAFYSTAYFIGGNRIVEDAIELEYKLAELLDGVVDEIDVETE